MPGGSADATVHVDGHRIGLTNLDKVLYPAMGTSKTDLIAYYAAVSAAMIPHLIGRPVTRKRWPSGVDAKPFFEKNLGRGVPSWVRHHSQQHSDRSVDYPVVDSVAALVWLAQLAALELHVPQWCFGARGRRENPDRLVFDLDPGEGATLTDCATVARAVRDLLGRHGSSLVPVTSGSKGMHLYLGLNGTMTSDEASDWAHRLARSVERSAPDLVVSRMDRSVRPGKVFIDWSQNNASKTTVAPYSLRGREHPMVAAPRTWEELEDPDLAQLDFRAVLARIGDPDDPWDPMADLGRRDGPQGRDASGAAAVQAFDAVRDAAIRVGVQVAHRRGGPPDGAVDGSGGLDRAAVRVAVDGSGGPDRAPDPAPADRLDSYRSKRSAHRTPEPVPGQDGPLPHGGNDTFVIQEHHARRLHWDFRLERDGVLVSWAVPKGLPVDDTQNRLAVQTEDHPLAYADFAGTIPKGEYGGGEVTIWDAGSYRTEKWREGEVIVVLHGTRARGRFVLVRTGASNWLMRRMKDQTGTQSQTVTEDQAEAESRAAAQAQAVTQAQAEAESRAAAQARVGGPISAPSPPEGGHTTGSRRCDSDGRLPRRIAPMLASPGDVDRLGDGVWRCEGKWDGIRAIVELNGGHWRAHSRAGNDLTAGYPELGELATELADHALVLDGEIVALDGSGVPSFEALQRRMGLTRPRDVGAAAKAVPVRYYAFDLLHLDGVSLLDKSYDDRRRLLEALRIRTEHCEVPSQLAGTPQDALAESRRRNLEGIVAKRADSGYRPGQRSGAWIKVKHWATQDVVVVGWRPGKGRREGGIGSLLVAFHDGDGTLVYAGRVGTGFTDATLRQLLDRLNTLRRSTCPVVGSVPDADAGDAVWVTPTLVGEVTYAEITKDGRLRQSAWRGLRDDVPVDQVRREG